MLLAASDQHGGHLSQGRDNMTSQAPTLTQRKETLTNSKLSPQLERLSVATVWGSFRNPKAPWGSGPRGFAERSRCTNECCMNLFAIILLASCVAAEGERGREGGREGEREGGREGGREETEAWYIHKDSMMVKL